MLENIEKIQFKIFTLYTKDYSCRYSILEITKLLGINYSNAYKRIKELVEDGLFQEETVGKSNLISLNIYNPKTIHILSFVEQIFSIENQDIDDLVKEINGIEIYSSIGLFGSRASGKSRRDSDWDLFIITHKKKEVKKILSKLPYVKNIQIHVFCAHEFEQSLLSPEETVVKHIVKNKKMIYNPYPFYNLIQKWERIKHAPTQ